MSINSIGIIEHNRIRQHRAIRDKRPKMIPKDQAVIHKLPIENNDFTKIVFPPFLPIGDTEII